MKVLIKYLTVGKWNENAYLIAYDGEAWIIDPGDDFDEIDNFFELWKFKLKGIINTHGHFDHVSSVCKFKEKYNIPFYLHSKDKQLLKQANLYRRLADSTVMYKTPEIDFFLDDFTELTIKEKKIFIHHTPGHSNGSVCFEVDQQLISGDILIKGYPGRTDLPGGNKGLLKISIDYIIKHFKGYTIYPGHGKPFLLNEQMIKVINEIN